MKRIISLLLVAVLAWMPGCGVVPDTDIENPPEAPTASGESVSPAESPLHSGLRADGSFSEGALFIGDSLTYGLVQEYLMARNLIGDASYLALVGAPISYFFADYISMGREGSLYSEGLEGLSYYEGAAALGNRVTAIYFMMGTNFDPAGTAGAYIQVVDYLLEACPQASIYLQLIPFSTAEQVDYEGVNAAIVSAWNHYQAQGETRVMVIDTFTAIGRDHLSDGVHLNNQGKDAWYRAIVAYAQDHGIEG